MSTYSFTFLSAYTENVAMEYKRALLVKNIPDPEVPNNATSFTVPFYVASKNLQATALINKNSTSGTNIIVYVNGTYTVVNAYNASTLYNQSVSIMSGELNYGLNWIEVDGAQNNGNSEFQAIQITTKSAPLDKIYMGKGLFGIAQTSSQLTLIGTQLPTVSSSVRNVTLEIATITVADVPYTADTTHNGVGISAGAIPANSSGIPFISLTGFTGLTPGKIYIIQTDNILKIE
jgi:hypothetical protein